MLLIIILISINIVLIWQKTLSTSSSLGRRHSGVEYDDITIRDCMLSFTREEVLDNDEQPVSCSVALIYTVNPIWSGLILLDFNLFSFIGVKFINKLYWPEQVILVII